MFSVDLDIQQIDATPLYRRPEGPEVDLEERADVFVLTPENHSSYRHQFANIYFVRLGALRGIVEENAKARWKDVQGAPKLVPRVLEVVTSQVCYIVGTVYMEMPLKPNIIDDLEQDHSTIAQPSPNKIFSSDDAVMLEDESGRIQLVGPRLTGPNAPTLVTGVIMAVLGTETDSGKFEVFDFCFADMAPSLSLDTSSDDQDEMDVDPNDHPDDNWIGIVSGLEMGPESARDCRYQMLLEFLAGESGGEAEQRGASSICSLIIAGNSVARISPEPAKGPTEMEVEGENGTKGKGGDDGEVKQEGGNGVDLMENGTRVKQEVPEDEVIVEPGDQGNHGYGVDSLDDEGLRNGAGEVEGDSSDERATKEEEVVDTEIEEDTDVETDTDEKELCEDITPLPTEILDEFLFEIASTIPVHILAGSMDPVGTLLPQQPLPRGVFEQTGALGAFLTETNPCWLSVGGRSVLVNSGQPLLDMFKYVPSSQVARLSLATSTLRWRHMAPTAPDTLWCYPYFTTDPFVMDRTPELYVIGNQPKFQTKMVIDAGEGEETKCRVVLVPGFADTGVLVLINTKTLEAKTVDFGTLDTPADGNED